MNHGRAFSGPDGRPPAACRARLSCNAVSTSKGGGKLVCSAASLPSAIIHGIWKAADHRCGPKEPPNTTRSER